jgi:post-segregation antitoxin (ccd killing protein)
MREEYDFREGQRGKFFRKDAELHLPVYLDADVQASLIALAKAKGVDISVLVNVLLKKDIELIQIAR